MELLGKTKTITVFDILCLCEKPVEWVAVMDNIKNVTSIASIYPERFRVTKITNGCNFPELMEPNKIVLFVEEIAE